MSQTVNVPLGGESISVVIDGGNMGAGASVRLQELNQAVGEAKQAADDAEVSANQAAQAAASVPAIATAAGAAAGTAAATVLSGLTTAECALTSISANVEAVRTTGHTDAGDGGSALYVRVLTEPTHAGKFQSADGAWWELDPNQTIRVEMFGARGDLQFDLQPVATGAGGGTEGFVRSAGTDDKAAFEAADAYGKRFGVTINATGQYYISGQFMPQACWYGADDYSAVIWCYYTTYERGVWIMSSDVKFKGFRMLGQYHVGSTPKPSGNGQLGGIISCGDYYTQWAQDKLTGIEIDVKLCRAAHVAVSQPSSPSIMATNMSWCDAIFNIGVWGKTNVTSQIVVLWHWGCKYTPDGSPPYPPTDNTARAVEVSYHPTGRLIFDDVLIDNADGHNITRPWEMASPGPVYIKPPRCRNIPQAYWYGCGDVVDAYTNPEQKGTICKGGFVDWVEMEDVPSTETYVCYWKFIGQSKFEKYEGSDQFLDRQLPFDVTCKGHKIKGGNKAIFLSGALGYVDLGSITAPDCVVSVENENGVADVRYKLINSPGTVKHESVRGGTIEVINTSKGDIRNQGAGDQDAMGWEAGNRLASIFSFDDQTTVLTAATAAGATRSYITPLTGHVFHDQEIRIGSQVVYARGVTRSGVGYIDHTPLQAGVASGATVVHVRRGRVDKLILSGESSEDGIVVNRTDITYCDVSGLRWTGRYGLNLVASSINLYGDMPVGMGRVSSASVYPLNIDKNSSVTCHGMRVCKPPRASSVAQVAATSDQSERGNLVMVGCLIEDISTLANTTAMTSNRVHLHGCVDFAGKPLPSPGSSGNDANGYWVRLPDGTQICWLRNVAPASDGTYTWTFPRPFLSTASTTVTGTPTSTTAGRYVSALNSSSTSATVQVRDAAGAGVASGVSLMAVGRYSL